MKCTTVNLSFCLHCNGPQKPQHQYRVSIGIWDREKHSVHCTLWRVFIMSRSLFGCLVIWTSPQTAAVCASSLIVQFNWPVSTFPSWRTHQFGQYLETSAIVEKYGTLLSFFLFVHSFCVRFSSLRERKKNVNNEKYNWKLRQKRHTFT